MKTYAFVAHLTVSSVLLFVLIAGSGIAAAAGLDCDKAQSYSCGYGCQKTITQYFLCCNTTSSGDCCQRWCAQFFCQCPEYTSGPWSEAAAGAIGLNSCDPLTGRCVLIEDP